MQLPLVPVLNEYLFGMLAVLPPKHADVPMSARAPGRSINRARIVAVSVNTQTGEEGLSGQGFQNILTTMNDLQGGSEHGQDVIFG